jgi:hypothetical protein
MLVKRVIQSVAEICAVNWRVWPKTMIFKGIPGNSRTLVTEVIYATDSFEGTGVESGVCERPLVFHHATFPIQ